MMLKSRFLSSCFATASLWLLDQGAVRCMANDDDDDLDDDTPDTKAGGVVDLTDATFQDSVMAPGKVSFVKFFAPWCGHCKKMGPDWEKLGATSTSETVMIAKVDCTVEKKVSTMMKIRGFPTLYLFSEGMMYEYEGGSRGYPDLKKFVEGGFKNGSPKNLPWNESFIDVAKEQVTEYFQRVGQVMAFDPSLLPLAFMLGVVLTVLFYSCFSSGPTIIEVEKKPKKEEKKD